MRTVLVVALLSGLLAVATAWPKWDDLRAKFEAVNDEIKDGYAEHLNPIFIDVRESWVKSIEPFFNTLAERFKNFVIDHKDKFAEFSNKMKASAADMDKCHDCAKNEDCSPEENLKCEEEYGLISNMYKYYDCLKGSSLDARDCITSVLQNHNETSSELIDDETSETVDETTDEGTIDSTHDSTHDSMHDSTEDTHDSTQETHDSTQETHDHTEDGDTDEEGTKEEAGETSEEKPPKLPAGEQKPKLPPPPPKPASDMAKVGTEREVRRMLLALLRRTRSKH